MIYDFHLALIKKIFNICNINDEELRDMYDANDLIYKIKRWKDNKIVDIFNRHFEMDSGATKLVLIPLEGDYVYKIPLSYSDDGVLFEELNEDGYHDFCEVEVDRCLEIKHAGFGDFIAKEEYVDFINGLSIYKMEKAVPFDETRKYFRKYSSDSSSSSCDSIYERLNSSSYSGSANATSIPIEWMNILVQKQGLLRTIDFFNYLIKNGWDNDLHSGNIGFINNNPVLIDYSGYIWQNGWKGEEY